MTATCLVKMYRAKVFYMYLEDGDTDICGGSKITTR